MGAEIFCSSYYEDSILRCRLWTIDD